jgi:hypothetical protein
MKNRHRPETRRSDEGRLFGYQALPGGTRFRMPSLRREEELKRVRSCSTWHTSPWQSRCSGDTDVRLDPLETAKTEKSAPLFLRTT